jgi:hypothetical protein
MATEKWLKNLLWKLLWLDSDISTTKTPNTPNWMIDYKLESTLLKKNVLMRITGETVEKAQMLRF